MSFSRAVALYSFYGTTNGDVSVEEGQVMEVIHKFPDGWWKVRVSDTGGNTLEGTCPSNYLRELPRESARSSSVVMRCKQMNGSKLHRVSLSSTEHVRSVNILGVEDGVLEIKIKTNMREDTFRKSVTDAKSLHNEISKLFPCLDLPELFPNLEKSQTQESLRLSLERYLLGLSEVHNVKPLLLSWCSPGETVDISSENAGLDGQLVTATALAAWEPQDNSELLLAKGDVITVLEKDDNGWWTGRASDGRVGVFPVTYVEVQDSKKQEQDLALYSNIVSESANSSFTSQTSDLQAVEEEDADDINLEIDSASDREGKDTINTNSVSGSEDDGTTRTPRTPSETCSNSIYNDPNPNKIVEGIPKQYEIKDFALESLEAFDELIDKGWALIVVDNGDVDERSTPKPLVDQLVALHYSAYKQIYIYFTILVWDGSGCKINRYECTLGGNAMRLTVGGGEHIVALDEAMPLMQFGVHYQLVVMPYKGYGDQGRPPSVGSNCHLVFNLVIIEDTQDTKARTESICSYSSITFDNSNMSPTSKPTSKQYSPKRKTPNSMTKIRSFRTRGAPAPPGPSRKGAARFKVLNEGRPGFETIVGEANDFRRKVPNPKKGKRVKKKSAKSCERTSSGHSSGRASASLAAAVASAATKRISVMSKTKPSNTKRSSSETRKAQKTQKAFKTSVLPPPIPTSTTHTIHSYNILKTSLPKGVEPSSKEKHLADSQFIEVFVRFQN